MRASLLLSLAALIVFSGCGYTSRSSIYPANTSIGVRPFKNAINLTDENATQARLITYFPLLEIKVTNAISDRLLLDGNLKQQKPEQADLILQGEITSYTRSPLQYADNNEDVTQYRITLFANIRLIDGSSNEVLWKEDNFAGDATYYAQGPRAKTETGAIEDAVNDLARRIVERIVESW